MPVSAILGLAGLAVEVAPTIARWIGGDDAGETTQEVADVVRRVTGTGDPKEARDAIQRDPALASKLEHALLEADVKMEKAYLADRQDARARDVAIRQSGGMNWRADALAILVVLGVITIPVLLIFFTVPEGPGRDLLMVMAGVLGKALGDIIHFEFGSSRGSKDKDAVSRLQR